MQMVSELVLTRNQLMQIARTRSDNMFMAPLQNLSQITSELQEGIMKTRMQPIGNAWAKFPRLIRDLSHELGKKIELRMEGSETELDRQLLELIKDPLTHMVRNSCDHGLEMPADRIAAGKNEIGSVTLRAYHEGGHIIIEIADDGRGLHVDRIKQKAVSNGLATPEQIAQMTDQQIMQFIFRAGFSTAEKVTSVSGRGVGMDVVRTNIEKIGGTIELSSAVGKGSKFNIKIPLTLAIVSVLIASTVYAE
jgi:two-component system chemotaxis sensor kinase CheA